MKIGPSRQRILRLLLLFPSVTIIMASGIIAHTVKVSVDSRVDWRLYEQTTQSTRQAEERLNDYIGVLYSGRAFMLNSVEVTQPEWDDYFRDLSVFERYAGISAISYIQTFDSSQQADIEADLRQSEFFRSPNATIHPASGLNQHASATRVVSNSRFSPDLAGLDLYADAQRRRIYERAASTMNPVKSTPLTLASGYKGFFLVLAVEKADRLEGFINVAFRSDEIFGTLFKDIPSDVGLQITDASTASDQPELFRSSNWETSSNSIERSDTIKVAERSWRITYRTARSHLTLGLENAAPYLILSTGIALAGLLTATGLALRTRSKT